MTIKVSDLIRTEIPDNVNLPGNEGMTLPTGTTAERPPLPAAGEIRYNTDNNTIEMWDPVFSAWGNIRTGLQSITFPPTVKFVGTQPSQNPLNQFNSIYAALQAITDNSASKQYVIFVEPGTYIEPQLVMKPYVNIISRGGPTITTVVPQNNSIPLFVGSNYSLIEGISIAGVANSRGIYFTSTDGSPYSTFRVTDVRFIANQIDLEIECLTHNVYSILNSLHFVTASENTTRNCWIRNSSANTCQVLGFDIDSIYSEGSNLIESILVDGNVEFSIDGFQASNLTVNAPGDGFVAQNGAEINLTSGTVRGFDRNIVISNIGTSVDAKLVGMVSERSTTYDLYVEQPSAVGLFTGSADFTKVFIDPASIFVATYSDVQNGGQVTLGNYFLGNTQESLTNVTPLIQLTPPTGTISGGEIYATLTPLQISIAAGRGYLATLDVLSNRSIKLVEWTGGNILVPDNQVSYIYVNSSGVAFSSLSVLDPIDAISLGRVIASSGTILHVSRTPYTAYHTPTQIDSFLREALGPIYISGSQVSENPGIPRALNVTAGRYSISTNTFNPVGGSPVNTSSLYINSGTLVRTPGVLVDNVYWNNVSSGLVPLSPGYYTKHILYVAGEPPDEGYIYLYGQAEYATLIEAEDAPPPLPPSFFNEDIVPIAAIIVQQGNPNIIQPIVDIRPRIGFQAGSASVASVHGNLLGLTADDHPQYLLADGTRDMLGNLDMNGNNIVSAGTVNGVTVQTHGARHGANSADPVPTAAPSAALTPSSLNTAGIANTLSRSDHTHQITGFQPSDPELTALANTITAGLYTVTGPGTSATRTLTAASSKVTVTNGNGVSGNPTIDVNESQLNLSTMQGVVPVVNGGTGLTALGTPNQVLGVNASSSAAEYKTVSVGPGLLISNTPGNIQINLNTITAKSYNYGIINSTVGSTIIPYDTSIPLITEGTELFTATITPVNSSSIFEVLFTAQVDCNSNNRQIIFALFRGSTCIAATATSIPNADRESTLSIQFTDAPATALPVTYSLRVGADSAATWYVNSSANGINLGGALKSSWYIKEF